MNQYIGVIVFLFVVSIDYSIQINQVTMIMVFLIFGSQGSTHTTTIVGNWNFTNCCISRIVVCIKFLVLLLGVVIKDSISKDIDCFDSVIHNLGSVGKF